MHDLTHTSLTQALVKPEADQRESDVRVAAVHFDLVCYFV